MVMQMGMMWGWSMMKGIQVCLWLVVNALVLSISHRAWIKWHKIISNYPCSFHISNYVRNIRTQKKEEDGIEYQVIWSWWLWFGGATEEDILGMSKWVEFWHFYRKQGGGHMPIVSASLIFYFTFWFLVLIWELYTINFDLCVIRKTW